MHTRASHLPPRHRVAVARVGGVLDGLSRAHQGRGAPRVHRFATGACHTAVRRRRAHGWRDLPWGGPLNARLWPHSLTAYWIGLALLIAGLAFAVWARVHLGRNWSGSVTVKEGHELIRSGPYALVRHPIYTGLITAVLGTAIVSGTVRASVGLVIITLSLLRKLRTEEALHARNFPRRI